MPTKHDSNIDMADILIVDDENANLQLLHNLLDRAGYQVRPSDSPQLAIDSALGQPPKLILLDVRMPEMDGFEVCERLRQDERTREIPVIFISALQESEDKVRGFKAGGVDFITKPFQEEEVLARVQTQMALRNMQLNLEELVASRSAELAISEARYRGLVENSMVGAFASTLDGRFTFVNDAMVRMFDFENPEQMVSHGSLERWSDPNDRERMLTEIQKHGSVTNFETRTITHTKRHIHVIFSAKNVGNNIVGMVMDITERTQAEESLSKSEAKYRGLVDNSIVGVFTTTVDGRFLFVNDAMVKLYEFDSQEQMLAEGAPARWADPREREKMLASLLEQGSVTNHEVKATTKTGRHIYLLLSAKLFGENIFGMLMDITERKQAEIELKEAYTEIERLKSHLEAESAYLQEEIKLEHNFENIIGQSEVLKYVLHRVEMVASHDSTVILLGESGTGKELIARALHQLSSRNKRPLVKVNCAALPAELIESELFGREKGAFTGATTSQVGRFELANKSTLFLDEIGEMPLELQAKLLRVLESGEFERLGNPHTMHTDARIIAATNRNLETEVRKRRFREDLWYRLKIFPITLPPLRDRIEDIPLLLNHFIQLFSKKMGKKEAINLKISKSSMQALQSYSWPGNVRELMHVVETALITSGKDYLYFDLPKTGVVAKRKFQSFEDMEREYIFEVLKATDWKVGGKDSASSILELPPSTLRSRIKKLGLKRP